MKQNKHTFYRIIIIPVNSAEGHLANMHVWGFPSQRPFRAVLAKHKEKSPALSHFLTTFAHLSLIFFFFFTRNGWKSQEKA